MPATSVRTRPEAQGRRAQILDETLRIVGQRGYHGFGISELAERCGLTKPGLLHHFGTKEQLLIALLEDCASRETEELSDLFLPAYEAAKPSAQRKTFHQSMLTVMQRAKAQPELMRLDAVLRAEAINDSHPAHQFFDAREEAIRARIAGRVASFHAHPESCARQMLAMMAGLQEQWLREGDSFDLLAEWDRALALLLA